MTIQQLEQTTAEFFRLHWVENQLGPAPRWTEWAEFLFGSVPNYECGGCYAIFSGVTLVYIGLGASRGNVLYPNHGISRRLMAHVIRSDRARGNGWSKLTESWADATAIHTIGLPTAEYLSASLETYLIRELSPPKNSRV